MTLNSITTIISNSVTSSMIKKTALCTHIDIFQVQEVKYNAVSLPDDWRAQRPLDCAGKDGAEANRYCGDANLLVLRQAQLHNLCWTESIKENYWCGGVKMDPNETNKR